VTPPAGQRPVVWFIDTASLISMAIDPRIDAEVKDEMAAGGGTMVLIDVVRDELEYRGTQATTAALAHGALASIGPGWPWLSTARTRQSRPATPGGRGDGPTDSPGT
jgi:hypothetical protein